LFQCPLNLPDEMKMKWSQLKTLIAVERHRKVGNKTSIDTHFYVSSAELTSEAFGTATVSFYQSDYSDEQGKLQLVQAYASKVYSAQGATVDGDTFVLYTSAMDRAASYVAGSRHKDNCHWFVNGQELDAQSGQSDKGEAPTLAARLKTLARCMSINKHKAMASEYLAEQASSLGQRQQSPQCGLCNHVN